MGTFLYSSPEILSKNYFSKKSDNWALGIILFYLTNLKLPFAEGSFRRIMDAIQNKELPKINPIYSQELQEIIKELLCKDQSQRLSLQDLKEKKLIKNFMLMKSQKQEYHNKNTLINSLENSSKSAKLSLSEKSLKNDFENCKIYKNSNFITKDVLEKLENENLTDNSQNTESFEVEESVILVNKDDSKMKKEINNEDMVWLRERMSIAGSYRHSNKGNNSTKFSQNESFK